MGLGWRVSLGAWPLVWRKGESIFGFLESRLPGKLLLYVKNLS